MINHYFVKADAETRIWFGIDGFRFHHRRRSSNRKLHIVYGWYFRIFIFGYEFCINRERTKKID